MMDYAINITEKVYINGVEFEDINTNQLDSMIDDIDEEIRRLERTRLDLLKLIARKGNDG